MLLDIYLGLRSAIEGRPVGPEFVPYYFPENECLKLHVIGTCGECEFMDPQVKETTEYNVCINKESSCNGFTTNPWKNVTFNTAHNLVSMIWSPVL